MKAIRIDDGRLIWTDAPAPEIGPGLVRIAVQATAVNRADLVQRSGNYPPPPGASDIMGLECAGEVVEVGEGVARVKPGDRVCALLAGGGYAEQVVVPAGQVLKVPSRVRCGARGSDSRSVRHRLPEPVHGSRHAAGRARAAARRRERGRHRRDPAVPAFHNPCFVTAGSAAKIDRCVALGADGGFDRHDGGFEGAVKAWAPEGVDVILDPVGGAYLTQNLDCLALGGRLVLIGLMGGAKAEIGLGALMLKRARVIGSTLRARPIGEKAAVMDQLRERVWPLLASGAIEPVIEAVLPIDQAEQAHALVAGNETVGKVVLQVG
jgi:NADPH:quinone reductase-like Zn-dependent oxidoreductase